MEEALIGAEPATPSGAETYTSQDVTVSTLRNTSRNITNPLSKDHS
jgi:hypothetical protein